MIIAVDFDGTVVDDARAYEDVTSPLVLRPGAKRGLRELKLAGHTLILWSGRANRALREDQMLDPLVRAGVKKPLPAAVWRDRQRVNVARYEQMLRFMFAELPGIFSAVDDGQVGKVSADLYIDDKALRMGFGPGSFGWKGVAQMFGEAGDARRTDQGRGGNAGGAAAPLVRDGDERL